MRKSFFLFLIFFLSLSGMMSAQNYYDGSPIHMSRWRDYQRKSYFGIRFGLNVPTLFYRGVGGVVDNTSLPRFHVGLVYGNKLGNGLPFFFESGLLYTEKGTEIKAAQNIEHRKAYLKYLEIPFLIKYKINTNVDDLTIQPFFGGYMAFGIAGKIKCYDTRSKIKSFHDDRFKRFDAGVRVGCGMAFQNLYFEMSYDIGLFNMAGKHFTDYNYDSFDGYIHTGNFAATLGVEF